MDDPVSRIKNKEAVIHKAQAGFEFDPNHLLITCDNGRVGPPHKNLPQAGQCRLRFPGYRQWLDKVAIR